MQPDGAELGGTDRTGRRLFWLLLCGGALLCALIAGAGEILPALVHKAGFVWTPFAPGSQRFGDGYYYIPWVREILEGHFPPTSPTAGDRADILLIDSLRVLPSLLVAGFGILFHDIRYVILGGILVSPMMYFVSGFAIAYIHLRRPWLAFLVGFLVVYYGGVWVTLADAPGFFGGGLTGYLDALHEYLGYGLRRIRVVTDYEMYADNFRFMHMSISGGLLMLFFAAVAAYERHPKPWLLAILAAFCCGLPFSYPTHPAIAYAVLGLFVVYHAICKEWRHAGYLSGAIAVGILFLLAIRYPQLMVAAYSAIDHLQDYLLRSGLEFRDYPFWKLAYIALVNKYTLALALMLLVAWRNVPLRRWVIVLGGLTAIFATTLVFADRGIASRLLGRGIDFAWFATLLTCFLPGLAWLSQWLAGQLAARARLPRQVLPAAIFVALIALPAAGFVAYGIRAVHQTAHYMPRDQWDMYAWIDRNLPENAAVAAFNWEDIEYIPIYTPADLVFGHVDLSARTAGQETERFLGTWKMLGLPRDRLEAMVRDSVSLTRKRHASDPLQPPFLTPEQFDAAQIAAGLIYFPYIRRFDDIPIELSLGEVNEAFVAHVMAIYDALDVAEFRRQVRIDHILLPAYLWPLVDATAGAGLQLMQANDQRRLYRVASAAARQGSMPIMAKKQDPVE